MTEEYKSRTERRRAKESRRQKRRTEKGRNKGSFGSLAKKLVLALVILFMIGLIGGLGAFAYFISDTPELDPQKLKDPVPSQVYDMNNEVVTELGTEKRDLVAFDDVPELVKNAILATEDVRFFKHHGIDFIRLGAAVISNVRDGFGSQGASTLTQQVVKLSFLSNEKTLERKAQEAWLAFQLERHFSKEEIFEMYVNKVAMGGNIYGIKAAANTYFGKELEELTLPEAALIAGLPQRPNAYNPFVNPDLADQRKNTVLSLMNQHGFISEEEMKKAQNTHVSELIVDNPNENIKDDSPYDAFVDQIIDEVTELGYNPFTDGLKIYTTLDRDAQKRVHEILNTDQYIRFPNDQIQAGVVLLDTKTGEIRAIGGGRHQKVRRGLNYAIDIKRQPGSTIKPILDYGPAIEYLKWSTYHQFEDKPYTYPTGQPVYNWNRQYHGNVSMRYALQWSLNIPAVQALEAVGLEQAKEFATNLGIPIKEDISHAYALGGFKYGFAPIHLAGAFSSFGNDGMYTEPHAIRKIILSDGETSVNLQPKPKRVMSDYTAFMISDMLKTVVQSGTGTSAAVSGVPIAGKTGTTNYTDDEKRKYGIKDGSPDAWFAGYSTNYTAAVWVGYEDKKKPVDDTKLPLHIFRSLMTHVHEGIETPDFRQPDSVVKLAIEKGSNPPKLAGENTPEDEIVYEYFVKGTEPKEKSKKFDDKDKLPQVKNLSVDYNEEQATATLTWDFDSKEDDVSFEVYLSSGNSGEQLVSETTAKRAEVANIVPGLSYRFTVYPVIDGKKGKGASVTLDLSRMMENEEQEDKEEENGKEQPDDEQETGQDGQQGEEHQSDGDQDNAGYNNGNQNNQGEQNDRQNNGNNPGQQPGNTGEQQRNQQKQQRNESGPNNSNGE